MSGQKTNNKNDGVGEDLFRSEALDALNQRHYGQPIAVTPRFWSVLGVLILLAVLVSAVYLGTSTYARKERVVGWIVPDAGLVRLGHPAPGQVQETLVEAGDSVRAGQSLVMMSFDSAIEDGTKVNEQLLAEIQVELSELDRQIHLVQMELSSRRKQLLDSLKKNGVERSNVKQQISAQDSRISIARDVLSRFEALLEEKAASHLETERQREQLVIQTQSLYSLQQRLIVLEREGDAQQAELETLPITTDRTVSELSSRKSALLRQKTELKRRHQIVLTAPVNGKVAAISAEQGSLTNPQLPVLTIIPEGSVLYAQVFIPSRAIGFVEVGQRVRLMYAPFPHQRYGSAWGDIESVSTSVLRPEEIPSAIGLEEPAYKARVRLDRQDLEAFGRTFPLRPGMGLSAEIIQEKRTFLQFILEPLRARGET